MLFGCCKKLPVHLPEDLPQLGDLGQALQMFGQHTEDRLTVDEQVGEVAGQQITAAGQRMLGGGLESDENCHTFTEEDPSNPKRDIIQGLYVCGNVQGSRYAVEYPICMRGISHSLCVYYGYIAGKNCVAGL